MSLKDLIQAPSPTAAHPAQFNTSFGAVLRVETAQEVNGALKLTGTVITDNGQLPANSAVSVVFEDLKGQPRDGGKAVSNFVKGHDKKILQAPENAAGSFVILESCYLTGKSEGDRQELSSRWINTLAAAGDQDHANRSFVSNVYATAPRLGFKNPTQAEGEPATISLSANAKSVAGRVEVDGRKVTREFTREWAIEKLKQLPANAKVDVSIDTIAADQAVKVGSRAELDSHLREQLGRGTKAMALIRIADEETVMTRLVYVPFKTEGKVYKPDVDRAMAELFERNIMKGIPNAAFLDAIDAGKYVVEVVPGYRMRYAGDTTRDNNAAFKLVSDVKSGRAAARNEVIFGSDAGNFAKVILGGIARNEEVDGFSPMLVISAEPGVVDASKIETPHIRPRAPAHDPAVAGPADDAEEEVPSPRP